MEFIRTWGKEPGFDGPAPANMGGALLSITKAAALSRLQVLGVVRCDPLHSSGIPALLLDPVWPCSRRPARGLLSPCSESSGRIRWSDESRDSHQPSYLQSRLSREPINPVSADARISEYLRGG